MWRRGCILLCIFHIDFTQHSISPGDVTGQFTAPPPTCPGDTFTFRCNVTGDMSGVTIWRVGGSSECVLTHSTAGATATCGSGSAFRARPGAEFGTSAAFYSSTLSGTATSALNGTLVECFGPDLVREPRNRVGESTLKILGNSEEPVVHKGHLFSPSKSHSCFLFPAFPVTYELSCTVHFIHAFCLSVVLL